MSNPPEVTVAEAAARAKLALLIDAWNRAPAGPAKTQAYNDLNNFASAPPYPNLQATADAAVAAANDLEIQNAIDGMAAALNQVSDLQKTLKTAQNIAATGEKNLLFPRIASTLGQVDALLKSLKQQYDAVAANVNALKQGVDLAKLKDLATSVQHAATTLQGTIAGL